ncbi:MAG: hypothetical protein AABX65_00160 [Nanoarchaeota archaeon]|mgnify:CR=1 FL=1
MRYIRKDINKKLLYSIIVPIIFFVFFTVYYANALNNVILESNHNRSAENNITLILQKLNETSRIKDTALRDKATLQKRYDELITNLCSKLEANNISAEGC